MPSVTPDIAALAASIKPELVFAQVLLRARGGGYELRHVGDRDAAAADLKVLTESEARALAQNTAQGAFRPLKSAPNLRSGWRLLVVDASALGFVLNQLYPGAVADWYAVQSGAAPVTSFRDFTTRQTGMYRITTSLDDVTAGRMMRACCHAEFCLKRRMWSVGAEPGDGLAEKSVIPCLEPCAILLEFARKVARWQQQGVEATEEGQSNEAKAECDFDDPKNPRRLMFFRPDALHG